MKILSLEFSSSRRSVALAANGKVYCETYNEGTITPVFAMVARLLKEANLKPDELEMVAVGLGPGSYTGVRLSIAVAQGLALATNIKTAGVPSYLGIKTECDWVAVDAQRGEFYLCRNRAVEGLRIVSHDEIRNLVEAGQKIAGPDLEDILPEASKGYPDAVAIGELAGEQLWQKPAEQLEPIYLRPVAFVKAPSTPHRH